VVEVDAGYHAARARADVRRDREFGKLGWRVVRVSAELAVEDLEEAMAIIVAAVAHERGSGSGTV
jgi:very-short-patch-repair endonuclease